MERSIANKSIQSKNIMFNLPKTFKFSSKFCILFNKNRIFFQMKKYLINFFTFQNEYGHLTYVAPIVLKFIRAVSSIFSSIFPSLLFSPNIVERIRKAITKRIHELPWLSSQKHITRNSLLNINKH